MNLPDYFISFDASSSIPYIWVGAVEDFEDGFSSDEKLKNLNFAKPDILTNLIPMIGNISDKYLSKFNKELLAPNKNALLQNLQKYPPLYISIGLGPGSFTSLRLALMSAKTLALLLKIPLLGFSSLDFYLYSLKKSITLSKNYTPGIMIDAYKKQVYTKFQSISFSSENKMSITEYPPEDINPGKYFEKHKLLANENLIIAMDKVDKVKKYANEYDSKIFPSIENKGKIILLKDCLQAKHLASYNKNYIQKDLIQQVSGQKNKLSFSRLSSEQIKQDCLNLNPLYMRGPSVNY